jgi:hypothetical protein
VKRLAERKEPDCDLTLGDKCEKWDKLGVVLKRGRYFDATYFGNSKASDDRTTSDEWIGHLKARGRPVIK